MLAELSSQRASNDASPIPLQTETGTMKPHILHRCAVTNSMQFIQLSTASHQPHTPKTTRIELETPVYVIIIVLKALSVGGIIICIDVVVLHAADNTFSMISAR